MYEMLKEMIKPELFVLVPVLYLVGAGIKCTALADKYIPFILGVLGVLASLVWIVAEQRGISLMAVFVAFTQGVLCAGASVYINQIIKQSRKDE